MNRNTQRWKAIGRFALWTYAIIGVLLFLTIGLGGYFSSCTPGGWFCFAGDERIFIAAFFAGLLWPVALLYLIAMVLLRGAA